MSIIALSIDNVIDDVNKHTSQILILDADWSQITSSDKCNVSYDLRVGSQFRDHRDSNTKSLNSENSITIHPGTAFIIETLESINLPANIFGSIYPRVSLLQKGLANATSKIDPGYNGRLLITVFNLGKRKIELNINEAFCTVVFMSVDPPARLYSKGSQRISGSEQRGIIERTRDFLNAHGGEIATLAVIVTVIIAIFK